MPWFTPLFQSPPPPAPTPAPIYRTYVQPAPVAPKAARPTQAVSPVHAVAAAPVARSLFALPPALAAQDVPNSLRKVIYLSHHRQTTAQSILEVAAAQIGWRVDLRVSRPVPVPRNTGLVWMSDNPQGAPAIFDLWRIGVGLGTQYTININAANHVITFMKAAG